MTEEELYERTANWLREEMGFLVGSLTEIEEVEGECDIHFSFTDEDGLQNDCYTYYGSLDELKEDVEPYED